MRKFMKNEIPKIDYNNNIIIFSEMRVHVPMFWKPRGKS